MIQNKKFCSCKIKQVLVKRQQEKHFSPFDLSCSNWIEKTKETDFDKGACNDENV